MGKSYEIVKTCARTFWGGILGAMIFAIAPYFLLLGIAFIFFGAMFYPFVFLWKKYVERYGYPKNIVFRKLKEFSEFLKRFIRKIPTIISKLKNQ